MFEKYKKIIIVIILLGIGLVAYLLLKPDPTAEKSISISDSIEETELLSQEVLRAISQIKSLKLDRSIFDDPVLKSLDDKSEEIKDQPVGRNNPFAPLSGVSEGSVVNVQSNTNNR